MAAEEPFALWAVDIGPDTRLEVIYVRRENRCLLPCRFVGWARNGDLIVEVEQIDLHTGELVARRPRRLRFEEVVEVREHRDPDESEV